MLVTLDEMKTYLGIPLIDTTYDDFLTEQLNIVSSAIENYCGRKFNETSYVQTFYGDDYLTEYRSYGLLLYHFPLTAIVSVSDSGTVLDASVYRIHDPSGMMYRIDSGYKRHWFTDYTADNTIVVTYSAGYAIVPYEIQSVVKSLVEESYNKKVNGVGLNFGNDVQRISIPGTMSLDFDYSLQANERKVAFGMILGNYVNVLDFHRSERAVIGSIKEHYVS